MILITYNNEIIDYIDRYEIIDVNDEENIIKCFQDESDSFYYNGMVNRQSFEYFENITLPSDYYDEEIIYTFDGTNFVSM